jgi:hypothetical protein
MSNPIFIKQIMNNNQLAFTKAMPLKDRTSDVTSDFELGRKTYIKTYQPALTNAAAAELLNPPRYGPSGKSRILPTVFDGTHTPNQKKWMGSTNRDSSQVISNRKNNAVGKGTLNLPTTQQSNVSATLVGCSLINGSNYWSTDGLTWNQANTETGSLDTIWTGSNWLSTGVNSGQGVISTSTDGIDWTFNENSGGFFDVGLAVATKNNNIVVLGENPPEGTLTPSPSGLTDTIIYSEDSGATWAAVEDSTDIFTNTRSFAGVKLKGGLVSFGNVWVGTGSGPNSIGYSSELNGSIWQAAVSTVSTVRDTSSTIFQVGTGIANSETLCVSVGFSISGQVLIGSEGETIEILPSKLIAWSENGVNWTPANLKNPDNTVIDTVDIPHFMSTDVAFNGSKWVTICVDFHIEITNGYVFVSDNGKDWVLHPMFENFFPLSIVWNGELWISSGFYNSFFELTLLYSNDGINWEINSEASPALFLKMEWNGEQPYNSNNATSSTNTLFSFTNGNDKNLINHTLRRVRGSGSVPPPKKAASPSYTFVPSPGTHPYMQPGFKGKIGGYFPNSRYNNFGNK